MKKKLLSILAVTMVVALLSGCGLGATQTTQPSATSITPATTESPAATTPAADAASASDTSALPDNATDDEINNFITAVSNNPDKIVLKYASTSANLNGQSYLRAAREFMKVLKEELGDKIEIQYFMNSTFGGSADAVLGGLQMGTFEMTDWPCGSFSEYTNAFQPLDIPYLFTSNQDAYDFLSGEAGKIMAQKCIDDTGIKPMYYGIIGMRQITNSKHEIHSPDDMVGLKMRVQNNPLHMEGLGNLGCSVTTMAFSELFTSLQQGVVDGQENPAETIYNFQYYDVQKYMTLTNHLATVGVVAVNNDWYEGLSDEFKAAFEKAAADAQVFAINELEANESTLVDKLRGLMTVTELTDEEVEVFVNKSKEVWPELVEMVGADYCNQVLTAGGKTY